MSGHKRTLIALQSEDLNRLNQAGTRLRQVEKDFHKIKDRLDQTRLENLWQSFDQLQNRQRIFDESLTNLSDQILQVEDYTGQAILNQASEFNDRLQTSTESIWEDLSLLVDQQARGLQVILEADLTAQEDRFNHLYQSFQQIQDDQEARYYVAIDALKRAKSSFDNLQLTYDHNKYFPGELDELRSILDQAGQNMATGFYEAVLLASQQVTSRMSTLRIEMETILLQRDLACAAAREKLFCVLEIIRRNRRVRAVDMERNELGFLVDVDYWSFGLWTQTNQECRKLQSLLTKSGDDLDGSQVQSVINRLNQIEETLHQAVYQARSNVLSSQIRYNMAECVVSALNEQGYELAFSGYLGDDLRTTYQAVLQHMDGSQVTVSLSPIDGEAGLQTLDLDTQAPTGRSEHELRQQTSEISRALKTYGLQVGKISPQPDLAVLPSSPTTGNRQRIQSRRTRLPGKDSG